MLWLITDQCLLQIYALLKKMKTVNKFVLTSQKLQFWKSCHLFLVFIESRSSCNLFVEKIFSILAFLFRILEKLQTIYEGCLYHA